MAKLSGACMTPALRAGVGSWVHVAPEFPDQKQSGHLAGIQIDDAGGDGSARAGGNLYDRLRGRLDRSPALRCPKRLGPGRAVVVAHVNRSRQIAGSGSVGRGYGRIQPIRVIGITPERADWSIREAGPRRP